MKLTGVLIAAAVFFGANSAVAQYSSQKDAQYLATLKVVVNFKIDDEEHIKNVEALRQNQSFNRKFQRMLNKLSNARTKNTTNRQVLKILEKAGEDIYKLLD